MRLRRPCIDPSTEINLNYSTVHATIAAMKLAGTVSDAEKIRAQMDKAFRDLPPGHNPNDIEGLDAKGGTVANTVIGVVENGKVKGQFLRRNKARRG
jgi:branched-chain amino acid transport system substrate-binding protein